MADPVEPAHTVIQPRSAGTEAARAEDALPVKAAASVPCTDEQAPQEEEEIVRREEYVARPVSESPSAPEAASTATLPIAIGAVLNHIYRVDRFIARGGMGEVYEGTNVTNTEDRVAIKIMRPELAADAKILTLFRNEARTLTKLSHPGLVQYRLLAQEPQLHVLYIVMAYIDGPALSEVLTSLNTTTDDLVRFIRRLSSALAVLHALGKIHRDLSPDNILLPGGILDEATIIDLGIAKDLTAAKDAKTIVGSGFAGKFGYVAPEQFGDTRDVGPWTDVYSLGLVVLAVAARRAPAMGTNFAEALEKRRVVPDLSAVPPLLRPLLKRMLEPDRTKRFQSMDDVVDAVDTLPMLQTYRTLRPGIGRLPASVTPPDAPDRNWTRIVLATLGSIALVAAVWTVKEVYFSSSPPTVAPVIHHGPPARAVAPTAALTDVEKVRAFVAGSLPRIGCSWLNMQEPVATPQGVLVRLSGVAADPDNLLPDVAQRTGVKSTLDSSGVSPVPSSACGVIDVLRRFRAPSSGEDLHLPQTTFPLLAGSKVCPRSPSANILASWTTSNPSNDFYLGDVESDGRIGVIYQSRAEYLRAGAARPRETPANGSAFRANFCVDDEAAQRSPISGVLLITGKGPISFGSPPGVAAVAGSSDWFARFARQAEQKGWSTQIAWFKIELPEVLSGIPTVSDTATLVIDGHHVRLAGIEGLKGRYAEELRKYIAAYGNAVTCRRIGDGPDYGCATASRNIDVSNFALRNGAARTIAAATELQKTNEQDAKREHLGVWALSSQ